MSLYPDYLLVSSKRYRLEAPRFRLAWDDEISSYNYRCRTQMPQDDPINSDNPPAVLRFFPIMREGGDYRVNLTKDPSWRWQETVTDHLNGGDAQKFGYWTGPSRAQFNTTGWAQLGYIGMCGNEIEILEMGLGWVKFKTLKPQDWMAARRMSIATHPMYIHRFTCVTWVKDSSYPDGGYTRRINSTGTPRGDVFYPLVTWEGFAWIPRRFVVPL
jgi:hypothetical protein